MDEINARYGRFAVPAIGDLIGDTIRRTGEWAETEVAFLCGLINEGDVVIDVGACFGTHARAFSQSVGSKGKIYCLEASEENFQILRRNAELAPLHNIEVVLAAASDVTGAKLHVVRNEHNKGGTFLSNIDAHPGDQVGTLKLDDLNSGNVSLIKIDVEGAEISVLLGALETLKENRPFVFCEVNNIDYAQRLVNFWAIEGYSVWGVRSDAFNPSSYFASDENPFGLGSECGLLFVPNSRPTYFSPRPGVEIAEISTADDLAGLLLGQEQYLYSRYNAQNGSHAINRILFDKSWLTSSIKNLETEVSTHKSRLETSKRVRSELLLALNELERNLKLKRPTKKGSDALSELLAFEFLPFWLRHPRVARKNRLETSRSLERIRSLINDEL